MKTLPALFLCGFGLAASAFGQAPGSVEQTFYNVDWTPQAGQPDGKVLIAWDVVEALIPLRLVIARLNTDGSFDRSFDPGDIVCRRTLDAVSDGPIISAVADGKILVGMKSGGDFVLSDGESRPLVRLNSDGSVDSSFRYVEPLRDNPTVVPLPDGSILVGSVRLRSDGSVDSSFKPIEGCAGDEYSWRIAAVQPDGRILAISYSMCGPIVFRLLPDGSRDPDFHPPITDGITDQDVAGVRVLPDNKILVYGWFGKINGQLRSGLARLNSDGSLDEGFTPFLGGPSAADSSDAVIQSDGKIAVVGRFVGQPLVTQLVRLNSDGSVDPSFSSQLAPQCCPPGDVDLESFGIRSLVLDAGGSFWVASFYTEKIGVEHYEVNRLYGDLPGLRLSAPKRLPNGTVEILCTGPTDRNAILQATSSISSGLWQRVTTNKLSSASVLLTDPYAAAAPQRFYRVVLD